LGHTSQFQRLLRPDFVTAATSLNERQPNCATFGRLLGCCTTVDIHFWGLLLPDGNLPRCKFTFLPTLAFSYIGSVTVRASTALQQRTSTKLCSVVQGVELRDFHRGRHQYSAGRPSRWALAHILVFNFSHKLFFVPLAQVES